MLQCCYGHRAASKQSKGIDQIVNHVNLESVHIIPKNRYSPHQYQEYMVPTTNVPFVPCTRRISKVTNTSQKFIKSCRELHHVVCRLVQLTGSCRLTFPAAALCLHSALCTFGRHGTR